MLGRLARWLRILGYDTVYGSNRDDSDLLRIASDEVRILVTRDKNLHRRAVRQRLEAHFLEPASLYDSLDSLRNRYGIILKLETISPRCSLCNSPLHTANKETIKTVPISIQQRHLEFWHCPGCGKTYWQGTHWENMRTFLTSNSERRHAKS